MPISLGPGPDGKALEIQVVAVYDVESGDIVAFHHLAGADACDEPDEARLLRGVTVPADRKLAFMTLDAPPSAGALYRVDPHTRTLVSTGTAAPVRLEP
jgi:hypothetical protein